MNATYAIEDNSYERIAVNLAELISQVSEDREGDLHRLLSSAYQAAYKKAAETAIRD
jgi:hypothetical protein